MNKVEFDFGEGFVEYEAVLNNLVKTERLHNNLKMADNSVKFSMVPDIDLYNKLTTTTSEIIARITDDGNPYFYGYVRKTYNFKKAQRLKPVDIEIVSPSFLIKKKIGVSNTLISYKVLDNTDTANSIIHHLLGYTDVTTVIADDILTTLPILTYAEDEDLYSIIQTLLFEYGYVFDFDNEGKFVTQKLFLEDISTVKVFNGTNCLDEINQTKKEEDANKIRVAFKEVETVANTIVFRDTTDAGLGNTCNIEVLPNSYFGKNDVSDSWFAEYGIDGKEVLAAINVSLDIEKDPDITVEEFTPYNTKALLKIKNTNITFSRWIRKLDIKGSAIVVKAESYSVAATGEKESKYDAQYIFDKASADYLASGLLWYNTYSDFIYKLKSKTDYNLGDLVVISDYGLGAVTARIIDKVTRNNRIIEYVLEAVNEYLPTITETTVTVQGPAPSDNVAIIQDELETEVVKIDDYFQDTEQTNVGEASTTIPEIPIMYLKPLFKAVEISFNTQANLSNFGSYEIQISKDGLSWYSLNNDLNDWRGTENVFSKTYHPRLVNTGLEAGTEYYYRARRLTKANISSDLVTYSVETLLIETGDVAANSITAEKLVANIITALFAEIEGFITVSADSGFISGYSDGEFPPIGARRSRIDGEKIGVQVHLGNGIWADVSSMDINKGLMSLGLQGGPALALYTGSFSHMAKDGFSIGREVPSGAHAFLFENSIQDFNAQDYFDSGSATYTPQCKHGEFAAIGGGHLIKNNAFNIDQDDWTIEFWYRLSELPIGFFEIARIESARTKLIMAQVDRSDEYSVVDYTSDYFDPTPVQYHKTELCLTSLTGTVNYLIDEDGPINEWRYVGLGMNTITSRKLFWGLNGQYHEEILANQEPNTESAKIEVLKDSRVRMDTLLIDQTTAHPATFLYESERAVVGYGSFRTEDSDMILWSKGQMVIKQPKFKGDWIQTPVLTNGVTDAPDGAIYYDETAGKFKGRASGTWVDLH